MKTHRLIQGSKEWISHRSNFFNASDAPAMLGLSEYKTRTQLLHELHTGLEPEVDAATQRRFDAGHRFEALARPLAEEFIGQDLYPVTGSEGKLSASFDGLTMCESIGFEHKTLNDNLRRIMVEGCSGGDLDMQYQVQMEQQLMVSGAGRILFMASKWEGEELIEERHCWYESNPELRRDIMQGWTQFAIDLAAYVPAEVVAKAVGHTPETLPALHIEVTGMVTASNLDAYKAHALAVFSGINRELVTDQQFADAERVVKWCGDVEDRLSAAKQHALSQTSTIDELFRAIDDISSEAKRTRLELDKLVKARKEVIRGDLVTDGAIALRAHIESLNVRLGKPYMPMITADFAAAIKGKRMIDSLRDAVNTTLANAKIEASAIADRIDANLRHLSDVNAPMFLFSDLSTICNKAADYFEMLVKSRISEHAAKEAAKEEAQRERIRAEEVAKLAREQAEAQAKAQREADAATKASAEAIAKAQAEQKPAPAAIETVAQEQSDMVRFGSIMIPREQIEKTWPAKTAPAAPPELKLGQIADRLGFTLTASFLSELGFELAATDRASKLYRESDWPLICAALVKRINSACTLQAA